MKLSFRQGVVKCQTDIAGNPAFLQKHSMSGDYIDLIVAPTPTIVTFAHLQSDYLIEESKAISKAWGPFIAVGQTQYLYWDLDILTGTLTRGFTLVPPLSGQTLPHSPVVDTHFFDLLKGTMQVWDGTRWKIKIRCFAAIYNSSAVIIPFGLGSQIGVSNTNIGAGSVLFGKDNRPLRHSDGTLVTSEDELIVGRNSSSNVRFDAALIFAEATESIPMFTLVSYINEDQVARASYMQTSRQIAGAVIEDLYPGEVGKIITHGRLSYEQWAWPSSSIGKPLFCSLNGEITLTPPPTGISQQVGLVQNTQTIVLNIMMPIIISP